MLRALRSRNYRLFFSGQFVSLIGTWLTTTASSWLVLTLATDMRDGMAVATVLGIVRFAAQIPMSGLAPIAGVMVDRWNRHHVMVITTMLALLQSAAMAYLTLTHQITINHIIWLSVCQGLVNAFDAPARQAFVVELVETRDDLPNAIALNSSMFNGARLLGPAVGGLMIAKLGEGACFLIDAISYLAVLAALLAMRLKPRAIVPRNGGALRELREGFLYAIGFAPVRMLLLLCGFLSFTVAAYQTLMPIFAEAGRSRADGAAVFGFMGAAVGVGALAGAVYLASRRTVLGLGKVIAACAVLTGIAMAVFPMTTSLPLMLAMSVIAGFGMIVTFAASNTLLQTIVEDDMRGRLMSFFIVAVMGAAPLGSLISGWTAHAIGESWTIILGGMISVVAAGFFITQIPAMRRLIRPIYIKRGILPEMAKGMAAADQIDTADAS